MTGSNVLRFERSWRSLIPQFLLFGVVLWIGLYVTAYVDQSIIVIPFAFNGEEFNIRFPIFVLILLFIIARPIIQLYDSFYEISDHHLRFTRGRFSIRRKSEEFAFEDLLGVQVTQSIIERILGVGTITVGSKTADIHVKMEGIKNPEFYAKEVSKRIDSSRLNEKHKEAN